MMLSFVSHVFSFSFTLEDQYGLKVGEIDGQVCLYASPFDGNRSIELNGMLFSWLDVAKKLKAGEITKEDYDRWRYHYPEFDTSGQGHKVLPQSLSDAFTGK